MQTQLQFRKKLSHVGANIDRLREKAGVEYIEKANVLRAEKNQLNARWRSVKNDSEEAWENVEKKLTSGLNKIEAVYEEMKNKITKPKTHA